MAARGRSPQWRAGVVTRMVELRPLVLALMRESAADDLLEFGQVTGRQLQALAHLPDDGVTMGHLAAFLRVTGAAASVLAERLVAQGLAVRRPDPGDRRVVRLVPTPEGAALAERYRDNQRQAMAGLLDRLSDAQAAAWLDVMETLAADGAPVRPAPVTAPAGAAR